VELTNCTICPHDCRADRTKGPVGKCRTDSTFNVAAITLHTGEEPVISGSHGICNIFFAGCNLRCIYCQNHQISGVHASLSNKYQTEEEIIDAIEILMAQGAKSVGFVSPSHLLPQVIRIINAITARKLDLVKIYNTNAYEKTENLRELEGLIDVYLPDYKYSNPLLAEEYSGAKNYPEFAAKAIKEMYRQKGSKLFISDEGYAESGMIIRHLVLPGSVENSLNVLRYIAEEISTNVHISLMSQYYPVPGVKDHIKLGRYLKEEEYKIVVEEMDKLGFQNGFTQEFESNQVYKPDFNRIDPFVW